MPNMEVDNYKSAPIILIDNVHYTMGLCVFDMYILSQLHRSQKMLPGEMINRNIFQGL